MTSQEFDQAQALFVAASDLPLSDREEFLRAACARDTLRDFVVELLEQDRAAEAEHFLIGPRLGPENAPLHIAPSSRPPLPEFIGRYEILEELGYGGMGIVYRARQPGLERVVALKVLQPSAAEGGSGRARFLREAEAVARLQHPHIVQIFEIGHDADKPYFSMEFMAGGGLGDRLRGSPVEPRLAAQIIRVLAEAVEHAHAQGIIHRDLKPNNILLKTPAKESTSAGGSPVLDPATLKIADFGLAKRIDGPMTETRPGVAMGTPPYMSPEQALADKEKLGPATDLYALGAILYELLTGRPPFLGANSFDIFQQVVLAEPVPPSKLIRRVPRDLETICLKLLQKEPRRRYASAQALADDLGRFLSGDPIHARPVSALARGYRWCKRNRLVATLLILLGLALLGGVGGVLAQTRQALEQRDRAEQSETELVQILDDALAQPLRLRNPRQSAGIADQADIFLDRPTLAPSEVEATLAHNLAPYREPMLQSALATVEQQLQRDLRIPNRQPRTIRALLFKARICAELQNYHPEPEHEFAAKGSEALLQAVQLAEELERRNPSSVSVRDALSEALIARARQPKVPDASALVDRAIQLLQQLRQDDPRRENRYLDRLAHLYSLRGSSYASHDSANALYWLRQAKEIREQQIAEDPHANLPLQHLNTLCLYMARILEGAGRRPEALREIQNAIRASEQLTKAYPDWSPSWLTLANSYNEFGLQLSKDNKQSEAIAAYERARDILDAVVNRQQQITPYLTEFHKFLAQILNNLALEYQLDTKRNRDRQAAFFRVNRTVEHLLFVEPRNDDLRLMLATSANDYADCLDKEGQKIEAAGAALMLTAGYPMLPLGLLALPGLDQYTRLRAQLLAQMRADFLRALGAMNELVRLHSTELMHQRIQGGIYGNLSDVEWRIGTDRQEAVQHLQKAIAILSDVYKHDPKIQDVADMLNDAKLGLVIALRELSDLPGARAAARSACDLAKGNAERLTKIAAELIACTRLAASGPQGASRSLADEIQTEVVTILKEALTSANTGLPALHQDPTFTELRNRPDFQALLRESQAKAEKKKP